jgi:hypothetical protein
MNGQHTRVIEVDEYGRRLIIGALNDKRNELVERERPTDFVDEVLMGVISAKPKKQKHREREVR